jgi:hypothetical protein
MAKESNAIGLMLCYRAHAQTQYRRAVEDFDRLKAVRHEMPNEPNIGLEPSQPEHIQPIEDLSWELPHIRCEQQNKARHPVPNEPNEALPDERHILAASSKRRHPRVSYGRFRSNPLDFPIE